MNLEEPIPGPWRHRQEKVNGLRFHYVEAGSGPLVILLHGFPEFWYCWRRQVPVLAEAGFRVLAPDLRGYNETDKPHGVENYRIPFLVDDVAGLIEQAGEQRAVVVGHDWGGVLAWKLAISRPERVDRLIVLNAPHPAAFRRELRRAEQLRRSWYVFFFQLPWLPEWTIRAGNFALLEKVFRNDPVHPGAYTPEDVERYKRALGKPGALTAALNWYRAAMRFPGLASHDTRPVAAPTLLIWGERDRALGLRLTEGLQRWVPRLRVERLPDASHWVQNDDPESVNRLMLEFLRAR
jgi:pimeloyl-ACP methyl ester carboxylesterase